MSKKKTKPIQHPEYEKSGMTRRQLLGRLGAAAGLAGATGYVSFAPDKWSGSLRDVTGRLSEPRVKPFSLPNEKFKVEKPAGAADVGVARNPRGESGEYTKDELAKMFLAAVDQVGGLKHYIKPGDIVMVKPNVAFDRSPNLGATSNPLILETLINLLLIDCKAQEVRVADNPIESPPDCFRKSGVEQAAILGGGRVYLPDSNSFKMLHSPGTVLIENWWFFGRPFMNVDKVIGLAPVKDHNLCHASMGIKNWYGLLGGTRNQFHQDIHEIVSDLSVMLKPTLTILDGTNVLMQNGPTGGDPSNVKKGDMIMAGVDPVALDAYANKHALERDELPEYLYKAEAKGSGKVDYTGRVREA